MPGPQPGVLQGMWSVKQNRAIFLYFPNKSAVIVRTLGPPQSDYTSRAVLGVSLSGQWGKVLTTCRCGVRGGAGAQGLAFLGAAMLCEPQS